ncbi:MAG: DUF885 domain-containing protein [Saprospiraceae bacterium]|nr:DUF885 domain-containing protein [Saprospiraceae bacterium]
MVRHGYCQYATWNEKGVVLPRALALKMIPQLESVANAPTIDHLFMGPVKKMLTNEKIDNVNKVRLTAEYTAMVEKIVKPSYKKLHDFVKKDYLPKTRISSGVNDVTNGSKIYAYLAKYWTTTDMTPDEIYALGESEVARIRAEMEKVKEQVGFKGDLKAFFKHVTEGEQKLRPFQQPDQVVANFNAIHQKMLPQLEKQFDLKPKTPFEVRRTEAFREKSASAEYNPGSLENARSGIFYVRFRTCGNTYFPR